MNVQRASGATISGATISLAGNPIGIRADVSPQDAHINNGLRKLGFWCALGVVYLRYSLLHEALTEYGGSNGKLLYVFSIPALFCLIASGGLQRFFAGGRPALYWIGFVCWFFLCVPFSFWKGDSAHWAWTYLRTDFPMMVFLASLPMTWKECRMVMYAIAFAGLTTVSFSRLFGTTYGGRIGLTFGTFANPNDYACVLILALPFMVFMVLRPMKVLFPLRVLIQLACVLAICYASYLVLASGSRGAMLGLVACVAYLFFKGTGAVRIGLLLALPIGVAALMVVLPSSVLVRLVNFNTDMGFKNDEASESAYLRKELVKASIMDTLTHPIFGVGPGQFENYEGQFKSHSQGGYVGAHNAYTQTSADTGLPGIFLYLAGTFSAFFCLQRTWRLVSKSPTTPAAKEMATACILISVSYIGYCVAITFLNFAYLFFLPGFAGLIIAVSAAVKRETGMVYTSSVDPRAERGQAFAGQRPAPVGKA